MRNCLIKEPTSRAMILGSWYYAQVGQPEFCIQLIMIDEPNKCLHFGRELCQAKQKAYLKIQRRWRDSALI